MRKQVAYDVHDAIDAVQQAPPKSDAARLAGVSARPLDSPARQLQRDVAAAFGARRGWSVRRTVVLGAAYHGVILSALIMAACETFGHVAS
ncbi:hypothetical protein CFHF_26225 [Caulobacter flavus]|uniref:Uncharacterized protein n=1 Tax=Caulobacter flavus TaxID=1679497 RepID=A0A2N5CKN0_9CAUL|nr:hypothetical protein [Caulobacter flavus]AYV47898.1 hypothetical protein C1707_17450 [Caulobacter flavus]PLR06037.1 hypothetical protein CFHF_26225 [Caulobacter flavus]